MRFAVLYSKKDLAGINISNQLKKISFTPNIPIIELKKDSIHSEDVDRLPELKKAPATTILVVLVLVYSFSMT